MIRFPNPNARLKQGALVVFVMLNLAHKIQVVRHFDYLHFRILYQTLSIGTISMVSTFLRAELWVHRWPLKWRRMSHVPLPKH